MTNRNKLLCLATALLLLVYSATAEEFNATPTDLEEPETAAIEADAVHPYLLFSAQDEGLTVTGCADKDLKDVTIPADWNGQPVVSIAGHAFEGMEQLEKVTIAQGVVSIGSKAFADCPVLQSVQLPDTLKDIAEDAFSGCPALIISAAEGTTAWQYASLHGFLPAVQENAPVPETKAEAEAKSDEETTAESSQPEAEDPVATPSDLQENDQERTLPLVLSGPAQLTAGSSATLKAAFTPASLKGTLLWSTSDANVATVNKNGKVSASKKITSAASVTITASLKSDASVAASWTIQVCPKATSVQLSAAQSSLDLGAENTVQLTAHALPEDAIQSFTWSSSPKKGVSISADGLATFSKAGTYKITAKAGNKSAAVTVKVSYVLHELTITGGSEVASEGKLTLKAVPTPGNATDPSVAWSSSNTAVAAVSKRGVVTAKKCSEVQTVVIRATAVSDSSIYAEQTITVRPVASSVTLTSPAASIDFKDGKTIQLSASCLPAEGLQGVTWSSSDTKTATVSADGLVTFLKQGTVTITAKSTSNKKAKASVSLTGGWLVKGLTITGPDLILSRSKAQLKLTADPVGSESAGVVWSTNNSRAKVDKTGLVTLTSSIKAGTVITVTAKDKLTGMIVATHTLQVYNKPTALKITSAGGTEIPWTGSETKVQLNAVSGDGTRVPLTWRSSDTSVATVDANGLVTFHSAGSVTIHAQSTNNELIYNKLDLYAYDETHPVPKIDSTSPYTGLITPATLMKDQSAQLVGSVQSVTDAPIAAVSVRVAGFDSIQLRSVCAADTLSFDLSSDAAFTLLCSQLNDEIGTYTLQLYAEDTAGKEWLIATSSVTVQKTDWDVNYLPIPNDLAPDSPSTRLDNFIKVLMSQIGYREGPREDTKYAAFMGINHNPWCASFVSWCAQMAGVPKSIIQPHTYARPYGICPNGTYYYYVKSSTMPSKSVQVDRSTFRPQRGDLIFFQRPGYEYAHIGVVLSSSSTGVTYIDGNGSPEQTVMVRYRDYTDESIAGYSRPNWDAE